MEKSVASEKPRRGFKEYVRKFFVSLKRNPQNIALVMMLVTYVFYSLNLTNISNCTAVALAKNMGQCQFLSMLLGILSFVSFLRAFPRREKVKLVMVGLTILMLAITTAAEFLYLTRINSTIADPEKAVVINNPDLSAPIFVSRNIVTVHIILLIVCIGLIALLPVYSKLLRKINTSIDVAGNENMRAIDMADDE